MRRSGILLMQNNHDKEGKNTHSKTGKPIYLHNTLRNSQNPICDLNPRKKPRKTVSCKRG